MSYVALLRGINVGGKNVIRMADLRACFASPGSRAKPRRAVSAGSFRCRFSKE
ncbi:MAG: DUF1697 domain-containing protein [Myxococcota bacterium]